MIKDIATLRIGDKVHYQPKYYKKDKWENGIIKTIPNSVTKTNLIFVVYNCAGDWKNYKNYNFRL